MRFPDIDDVESLWKFMTTPSEGLIRSLGRLGGAPIMILGGSGKMGKELAGLIQNSDAKNEISRKIMVASTFSKGEDLHDFEKMNITCFKGDLSDEGFLNSLPDAQYLVYMMGFKFGSSDDWRRAFQMNSVVPYLVGQKYANSSVVVFSSGNPYPHSSWHGTGAKESDALDPIGVYGWSIVARESSFKTTARINSKQKIAIYRLMYAQHLQYGVLVDLARMIKSNQPISLEMPAVNLISQRDANEVALRCFEKCDKQGWIVNAAGPVWSVRKVCELLGKHLGIEPKFAGVEIDLALLADDSLARNTFGEYRDHGNEMIEAVARWVGNNGDYWGKPTHFGRLKHDY